MDFQGISGNFTAAGVEALAITVFKDEKASSGTLKELDKLTGGQISAVMRSEEFKGEAGDTSLLRLTPKGKMKASRLLLVGVGDKKEFKPSDVAVAAGTATRSLRKSNAKSIAFSSPSSISAIEAAQHAAQGAITSQFELDKYKTKEKNDKAVTKFVFHAEGAKGSDLKNGLSRGETIGESMNFIFNRRAIPRSSTLYNTRIHRRSMQRRTDDLMGLAIGVSNMTWHLTLLDPIAGE